MKLSIAMTTFNGEKYIEKQLQSILDQTLKPDEVWIYDDCSKDDTVKKVRKFITDNCLKDWHFIVNDQNRGFIENFNQAISSTTGDIIFLCDQDDIWLRNKIELMSKKIVELGADCLDASFVPIDSVGSSIYLSSYKKRHNYNILRRGVTPGDVKKFEFVKLLLEGNISPGCTMCFTAKTREMYIKIKNTKLPHDYVLNIIGSTLHGTYFWNIPVVEYRLHENNTIGLQQGRPVLNSTERRLQSVRKELEGLREILNWRRILSFEANLEIVYDTEKMIHRRIVYLQEKSLSSWGRLFLNSLYWKKYKFKTVIRDFLELMPGIDKMMNTDLS